MKRIIGMMLAAVFIAACSGDNPEPQDKDTGSRNDGYNIKWTDRTERGNRIVHVSPIEGDTDKPNLLLAGDSIAGRFLQQGRPHLDALGERYDVWMIFDGTWTTLGILESLRGAMSDVEFDAVVLLAGVHERRKQGETIEDVWGRAWQICIETEASQFIYWDTGLRDDSGDWMLPKNRVDDIHLSARGYDELVRRMKLADL